MAPGLQLKAGNSSGNFSHSGQNKYRPIRKKNGDGDENVIDFSYFSNPDRRMKFENGMDPAIRAFEHIDSLPLHKIVTEVTKETIKDIKKIDFKEKITDISDGLLLIVNSVLHDDVETTAGASSKNDEEDIYRYRDINRRFSILRQRR